MAVEHAIETMRSELNATRMRLREAETTLQSIHKAKVEALVGSGSGGEEIKEILQAGSLADTLFNLVAHPILIVDASNCILRINDAARRLAGDGRESMPFNSSLPLQNMDGKPFPAGKVGNALPEGWIQAGHHLTGRDVAFARPDGETRYFLLDAKPVHLLIEGFSGGIISLTDITDRKRAEILSAVRNEQLRYQFQMTKSITDNVNEALILMDEDNRVLFQNPAAFRILHLSNHEMIGKVFFDKVFFEPDPEAPSGQTWQPGSESVLPEMRNLRALFVEANGNKVPVNCFYSTFIDGKGLRGSVLVITDIRIQVMAERALLQSVEKQRHSQKIEAIGRLAGGIAHDFNNLLLAILGFTDLSMAKIDDPDVLSYLMEVKKAGEKAAILTSQLLAYSRKQILAPKVRPINAIVEEARKLLDLLIGDNVRMETDLTAEEILVSIDEAKIQQVLVNIIINARDSMPDGGSLLVRTSRLCLAKQDHTGIVGDLRKDGEEGPLAGEYGLIEVTDTGHGMGKEILDRLFEPFFTTKAFGKGSGLGLSTAFGIVRQMGGYIQVFSEERKGSVFKLLLPVARPVVGSTDQVPTPADPPAEGTGETILLVEDAAMVRKLLRSILAEGKYRVIEAENGVDALEKLDAGKVHLDLVVTDVMMDKMGGVELADRLKGLYPDVNVLFMSGYAEDAHQFPESDNGESYFVAKPFHPQDFLKKVAALLDLRRKQA